MPTCVLYMRQSLGREGETEDTSLSLDSQESQIRSWCDRENFTVQDTYRDHGFRGTTLDRPGWNQLIERVTATRVDAVVVFALSRIARDSYLQETAWRQLKAMKIRLISVTEPSAEDTLVRGILGAVSQVERERLGKFVNAALTERVKRGQHVSLPPYGMRLTGLPGTPGRVVEIDPDTWPVAREIADRMLRGEPIFQIWSWLVDAGIPTNTGKQWGRGSLRSWFKSPGIAGAVSRGSAVVWDAVPGVVTHAEFDQIQAILATNKRQRGKVRMDTWLRGSIFHGCGKRMLVLPTNTTSGKPYYSYTCLSQSTPAVLRCDLLPRSGSQHKIEGAVKFAVAQDLQSLIDPDRAIQRWIDLQRGDESIKRRAQLIKQRDMATERHDRAEALYLSGKRDAAWLNEQDLKTGQVIESINRELATIETPPDRKILAKRYAFLQSFEEFLSIADDDAWKKAIREFGHVVVDGDTLSVSYNGSFAPLLSAAPLNWRTFDPSE